jgi:hypothetical protein
MNYEMMMKNVNPAKIISFPRKFLQYLTSAGRMTA